MGGGGGGWIKDGLKHGSLALELGTVKLVDPNEVPSNFMVATAAALGAPAQRGAFKPRHFIRATEMLREAGAKIDGLIAAENGGFNTLGGWIQGAALGLPVVDVPCDGRAHPTSVMGGMGLHRVRDYVSVKAVSAEGVEVVARGSLERTSGVARRVAAEVQGMVAMVRDPVMVGYALEHGAPRAISLAHELGGTILEARREGPKAVVHEALRYLGGETIGEGRIREKAMETVGGFDAGLIQVDCVGKSYEVTFFNEYMTVEVGGKRIATFPDLICTFSPDDGLPVNSAGIREGDPVILAVTKKERIPVGDGLRYPEVYKQVERGIKKDIIHHLKDFLKS